MEENLGRRNPKRPCMNDYITVGKKKQNAEKGKVTKKKNKPTKRPLVEVATTENDTQNTVLEQQQFERNKENMKDISDENTEHPVGIPDRLCSSKEKKVKASVKNIRARGKRWLTTRQIFSFGRIRNRKQSKVERWR